MAKPSGGTPPPKQPVVDANQAIALLATMHHWSSNKHNREGKEPRYSVTITHAGRRVTANRDTFVGAAVGAMGKLREPRKKPKPAKSEHVLKLAD